MIQSRNGHALLFGRLWYVKPDDAIDYAKFFSRSHDAVIRVYDEAGNVIETHEAIRRATTLLLARELFGDQKRAASR